MRSAGRNICTQSLLMSLLLDSASSLNCAATTPYPMVRSTESEAWRAPRNEAPSELDMIVNCGSSCEFEWQVPNQKREMWLERRSNMKRVGTDIVTSYNAILLATSIIDADKEACQGARG